jgi:hypothetical protein
MNGRSSKLHSGCEKPTALARDGRGPSGVSGRVAVYPRVNLSFPPSQVLADPVGGQVPFAPSLADGTLGNPEERGYLAR